MSDPLRTILDGFMAQAENDRLANSQALTLGELIARLESAEQGARVFAALPIGAALLTGEVESYRGYYSDLALNYHPPTLPAEPVSEEKTVTVAGLLERLGRAVGETFEGYKGGDFTMNRRTPVWVDNCGDAHGWYVSGISPNSAPGVVILMTRTEEW